MAASAPNKDPTLSSSGMVSICLCLCFEERRSVARSVGGGNFRFYYVDSRVTISLPLREYI